MMNLIFWLKMQSKISRATTKRIELECITSKPIKKEIFNKKQNKKQMLNHHFFKGKKEQIRV